MSELKVHKSIVGTGKYIGVFKGKFEEGIDLTIKFDYGKTVSVQGRLFYVGKDSRKKTVLMEI